MSDRTVAFVALAVVNGGALALAALASGDVGIALAGAVVAAVLLFLCFRSLGKPARAMLVAMASVATVLAVTGSLIGEAICSADDFVNIGQCRDDHHTTGTVADRDWHGWPIPWRTDNPYFWLDDNDTERAPTMITDGGTVVPLLLLSLTAWFGLAFAAEGIAVAGWRAVRRIWVHGTLFPST